MKAKVTKVMMWPSRKINLGNYNSAELNAGLELSFDTPVDIDSEEVKEAFDEVRKVIKDEFKLQFEPYKKTLKGGE